MPVYISLMHWTSQGIGGLPAWRDRVEESDAVIEERGGRTAYHDPHVTEIPPTREHGALKGRQSVTINEGAVKAFDAVLIATDHDQVDYAALAAWSPLIVDTRNVFHRNGLTGVHIVKA